jgi:hypothetical protein
MAIFIDRNDVQDIVSIVTACPKLRHVDLVMAVKNPPPKLRENGGKIVHQLLNTRLASFRLEFLNQPTLSAQGPIPIPLFAQITHLALTHPVANISEILEHLSYPASSHSRTISRK